MKSLLCSALFLVLSAGLALAGPYGTSTDCKAGVACPYPPNTPKASYFTSNVDVPQPGAPYDTWWMSPSAGSGGSSK